MTPSSQQRQYLQNSVEGASQLQLVVMLYDGALRFLRQAREGLLKKDIVHACELMLKAKAIVAHLLNSTRDDQDSAVAQQLKELYVFCYREITESNLEKDPRRLDGVIAVLGELRAAWQELSINDKASQARGPEDGGSVYLSLTS